MDEPQAGNPILGTAPVLHWNCVASDLELPMLRHVFDYWSAKRAGRRFPARRDIDPLDLRVAMGHLVLVDVQLAGPRFRYRLIGTSIAIRDGYDFTGHWIDELEPTEYRRLILARLASLAARPEPLLVRNVAVMDDRIYDYHMLWLPLADDGETLDMLLGCQVHRERR